MSLLEDIFLQDEAGEAQELERVVDGDEFDDQPRAESPNSNENSEKEDEAEEDKRRVDPTKAKEKRVIKHPRFLLNPARLTGPRGIQVIPDHFKDFKFKDKGHEKEDLDLVLKKLEHWAYRLYPKFQFEDCLKKIETLGKKRPVMVHLHKIRTDQFQSEETVVQKDSSDEEAPPPEEDEFDKLLQQQIEIARATPAPGSVRKGFETPGPEKSLRLPKATSSPSISEEQKERMLRNRKLAEERRLARLKQATDNPDTQTDKKNENITEQDDKKAEDITEHDQTNIHTEDLIHKKNRSNIIDSSDDENVETVTEVNIDIHNVPIENTEQDNDKQAKDITEHVDTDIHTEDVIHKNNRSNIIDSSDDENVETVTEVNIDIHNVPIEDTEQDLSENTSVFDKILLDNNQDTNSIDNVKELDVLEVRNKDSDNENDAFNRVKDNSDKTEVTECVEDNNVDNMEHGANISNTDNAASDNIVEVDIVQNSVKEADVKTVQDNVITEAQVDKTKNVNVEDELDLMDVDFSDDF